MYNIHKRLQSKVDKKELWGQMGFFFLGGGLMHCNINMQKYTDDYICQIQLFFYSYLPIWGSRVFFQFYFWNIAEDFDLVVV